MYTKWLNVLSEVQLFNRMERDDINRLLLCMAPLVSTFKKNEYIIIENDECNGPGIVLNGEIIVSKENAAGDRMILSKLETGDLFGEIFSFAGTNRWMASVSAVTDCTVMFIPADKLYGNCAHQCTSHKLMIQNMLQIVSQKAMMLNKKVDYLTIKSIRAKVSTYLLEEYERCQKLYFIIPLKRNELADFLNVTRPSLSRELIKMKEEGMIDFYRSSFKITDLDALKGQV